MSPNQNVGTLCDQKETLEMFWRTMHWSPNGLGSSLLSICETLNTVLLSAPEFLSAKRYKLIKTTLNTEILKLSFLILPKSDVWVLTVAHCVLKRNPDGSYSSRQISHEHFQIFHNVKNGYNVKTSSFRKTFKSVFNSCLYSMFVIKNTTYELIDGNAQHYRVEEILTNAKKTPYRDSYSYEGPALMRSVYL